MTLRVQYDTFIGWLQRDALPLWFERGLDRQKGGFFEKLSSAGEALDEPRRARVCGRQIFVFSTAAQCGWHNEASAAVHHGLDWLMTAHIQDAPVIIPLVDQSGCPLRTEFDLYDQAFVLFGLAAASAAGLGEDLGVLAREIHEAMVAGWKHPFAGFEEARPRQLPLKANPHMHLLEASLAWDQIVADPIWGRQADEVVGLCTERLLCPTTGALREYFDGEWELIHGAPEDVIEPGHQAEWAWLLIRWAQLRKNDKLLGRAARLLEIAEGPGRSIREDLLVNELNADLSVRDGRMRLWPQTERIKALIARASLSTTEAVREEVESQLAGAIHGLMRFFDHPVRGAWWEHIGPDGCTVDEPARASSLYHIVCAARELERHIQSQHSLAN